MKERFFDFEVFPHWWCCVFGDLPDNWQDGINESVKDTFVVVQSSDMTARDDLLKQLLEDGYVQMGYNIKHYDLSIANAIYQGLEPEELFALSDIIIRPDTMYKDSLHMRVAPFAKRKLNKVVYQDLMDDSDGSLKEKEAILGLDIEESEVDFLDENLTPAKINDIIYYCKHDVYAAMIWYTQITYHYVQTKLLLGRKFNIPETVCYKSTNATMVSLVLKAKPMEFTDRDDVVISLPSKIASYCYENCPTDILTHLLNNNTPYHTKAFNNSADFGNGGIHTTLIDNLYVESDDEWCLINVDAASFYPSMLIEFKCLSRTVASIEIYISIRDERVHVKHLEVKTQEDIDLEKALKLVLNTAYGASGNKYIALYDPYVCSKVCRLGQIFLAALANKIHNTICGAKIIQTNTDGILTYLRRKDLPVLEALMSEWTRISGIGMDKDYVAKIWQRDVNDYLLVKDNGKIKNKGGWLSDTYLKPGTVKVGPLKAFVSAKAVQEWLLHGTDMAKYIISNTNLMDFVMTCQKGPTFKYVVQRFADGHEEQLFKCNRVIASKDKSLGKIYKIKMNKGQLQYNQMPSIPDNCRTVNKALSSYNFNEIKKELDYAYYLGRAMDLADIEWKQVKGNNIIDNHDFDYKI